MDHVEQALAEFTPEELVGIIQDRRPAGDGAAFRCACRAIAAAGPNQYSRTCGCPRERDQGTPQSSTCIPHRDTLVDEVSAWGHDRNVNQNDIDWQFTTADARIKLKRLYPAILP